jgi:hypothetical protein
MAEAKLVAGNPQPTDYTPGGGNLAAGQVVLLGNLAGVSCGIAAGDIENNKLGALHVGGGIYDVVMLTNLAAYSLVYWDDGNNKVVSTSTNNAVFGVLLEGGTGANTTVKALHNPMAPRV